jgi:hypothetical protein
MGPRKAGPWACSCPGVEGVLVELAKLAPSDGAVSTLGNVDICTGAARCTAALPLASAVAALRGADLSGESVDSSSSFRL